MYNGVFAVCGGIFSEPTGVLMSPFYPNPYPQSRVCVYEIALQLGSAVELCFQDFEVEDTFAPPCRYDYLQVSSVTLDRMYDIYLQVSSVTLDRMYGIYQTAVISCIL